MKISTLQCNQMLLRIIVRTMGPCNRDLETIHAFLTANGRAKRICLPHSVRPPPCVGSLYPHREGGLTCSMNFSLSSLWMIFFFCSGSHTRRRFTRGMLTEPFTRPTSSNSNFGRTSR